MDIHSTVTKIRNEYKAYLKETHPQWSDSTVSTHASDAFYIWNNTITNSFWKCFKDDASMTYAKSEILRFRTLDLNCEFKKIATQLDAIVEEHFPCNC